MFVTLPGVVASPLDTQGVGCLAPSSERSKDKKRYCCIQDCLDTGLCFLFSLNPDSEGVTTLGVPCGWMYCFSMDYYRPTPLVVVRL